MEVDDKIILRLGSVNLQSYEFRTLIVILVRTYGRQKTSNVITLDEFTNFTGIQKPHIKRALRSLADRGVINIMTYKRIHSYEINLDVENWRSVIPKPGAPRVASYVREQFRQWFARYPKELNEADAEALYCELIGSRKATAHDLDKALYGYSVYERERCTGFNQTIDPLKCMQATTFLRRNRWKEFIKYADVKIKPEL